MTFVSCPQILTMKAIDFATLRPTMPMPEVTTAPFLRKCLQQSGPAMSGSLGYESFTPPRFRGR